MTAQHRKLGMGGEIYPSDLHNFYLKKLNKMRKFENVNVDMQAAS